MAKANKQAEVTAASLVAMAKDHNDYAKSHRAVARDKKMAFTHRHLHRALAIGHEEGAAIMRREAARVRRKR